MRLTMQDLAFAYELKMSGLRWQYIAIGLGCNPRTLAKRVRAEIRG
jgi:hypothetical protein